MDQNYYCFYVKVLEVAWVGASLVPIGQYLFRLVKCDFMGDLTLGQFSLTLNWVEKGHSIFYMTSGVIIGGLLSLKHYFDCLFWL